MALTERQKAELEVEDMKMLRFSLRVTRMNRIRKSRSEGQLRSSSLEIRLEV